MSLNHVAPAYKFSDATVDLWLVHQKSIVEETLLANYRLLASPEELKIIDSFHFAEDRHTALVTRAFVRCLLSCYLGGDPRQWEFGIVANGKPVVTNAPVPVEFNISHTRWMIVAAIMPSTARVALGVDVERMAADRSILDIAAKYFSCDELSELESQPPTDRIARFYDYWTLKESYIKATGEGLSIPLMDFSFHIAEKTLPPSGCAPSQISLSSRNDAERAGYTCQSWLQPAGNKHRIAISALSRSNTNTARKIRCFDMVPMQTYRSRSLPLV